jgi:dolichol kinase/phosphoserine phosphatase
MDERRKLVVFDVEGVLLPKNRYLIFEVGRKLSLLRFARSLIIGFLYRMGLLSLESALKNIFEMFRGLSTDELVETFRQMPLLPDTAEVFAQLKGKHLKTALISSGLPQVIVNDLASRLQTDYAFGLNLCTDNGILTGDIKGDVIKKHGKALVVNRIMVREKLAKQNLVVVADDWNNSPIFYPEALKVGFNPDFLIALRSDHVINESLLHLLPIIERGRKKPSHSLTRNEVIREAIHASGFLWALAATVFGILPVAFLLLLISIVYALSELAKIERRKTPIISSITLNATTLSERYEFATTPMYLGLGVILSLLLFPVPINYASVAVVCLGDSVASVFGKVFGKTPIPYNRTKNLEGSIAGFAAAFLGATIFLQPFAAFAAAVIGMFIESLPLPVNDNLSTPLMTGALLTLGVLC